MAFLTPIVKDIYDEFFHGQSTVETPNQGFKTQNHSQMCNLCVHVQSSEVLGSIMFYQISKSPLTKRGKVPQKKSPFFRVCPERGVSKESY